MYRSAASSKVLAPAQPSRVPAAVASSLLPLIAVTIACLLLAGCAQAPSNLAAGTKTAKAATTTAATPTAEHDAAADQTKLADTDESTSLPSIWQTADKLMGLESEAVRAALGAPARIRDEDTARIYQYVGGDCVLDLFLYQAEGSYRVTYAEARTANAQTKQVDACLKSLPGPIVAANTQPST